MLTVMKMIPSDYSALMSLVKWRHLRFFTHSIYDIVEGGFENGIMLFLSLIFHIRSQQYTFMPIDARQAPAQGQHSLCYD